MYMPVQCKWKYNAQAKCAVKVTLLMQKKSNTLQKKGEKTLGSDAVSCFGTQ